MEKERFLDCLAFMVYNNPVSVKKTRIALQQKGIAPV